MKSVGIDIGQSSVKIVEVQTSNKGIVVTAFKERMIGQNSGQDAGLDVVEFLREQSAHYQGDGWQVVIAMRQDVVAVRNRIFPFHDRLKILKSLPFELEEDFPFSPDSAIYDAKIVRIMGNSAEVLACAVPASRVADTLSRARDGGLNPHILSAEGLAYANLWSAWQEMPPISQAAALPLEGEARPERRFDLFVNIGHSRCLAVAIEDGNVIGTRSLSWGCLNLAQTIAKKYEITLIEALKIAQSRAFVLLSEENAAYDQIVFSQAVSESLRDLAQDLQMTLLEFQHEFNGRVGTISLSGGTSQIQNINGYLTQILEAPVNSVSAFTGKFATSFNVDTHMDAVGAVALGLALEGLKKPRSPAINFLKGEFQKQNRRLQFFWGQWGELLKSAAIVLVLFFVFSFIREQISTGLADSADEALKNQAKSVGHLGNKQANEAGVQKFIKDQHRRSQEVRAVRGLAKMNSALDWLAKISDAVPGKSVVQLRVTRFAIHDNRLELEGTLGQASQLPILQQSLGVLAVGGKVENLHSGGAPNGEYGFALAMTVDRGLNATDKAPAKVSQ